MGDFQFVFNGLTVGDGTDFPFVTATGLGSPPLRTGDIDRPNAHGMYPGSDWAQGRSVTLQLELAPSAGVTVADLLQQLAAAFVVGGPERPLTYQIPGQTERRILCRCRRIEVPVDQALAIGALVQNVRIQLDATDPRIYGDTLRTTAISLPTAEGGLTFPSSPNFAFGATGTGGTALVDNDGTFPTPWIVTIAGPVTDPRLEHVGQSKTLRFVGALAAGETLVIDSAARSVLLDGTSSRYSWLTQAQWFSLDPGSNQINYRATAGSGQLSLFWRDAWISM